MVSAAMPFFRYLFTLLPLLLLAVVGARAEEVCSGHLQIKPLLYRVQRGDESGYLVGTMHSGFQMQQLPEHLLQVLDGAADLTIENVPGRWDKLHRSLFKLRLRRYFGPRLSQRLSPTAWTRLVQGLGNPAIEIDRWSVLFASLMWNAKPDASDGEARMPMDHLLAFRATSSAVPVRGLEGIGEQFALMPKIFTLKALERRLTDPDDELSRLEDGFLMGNEGLLTQEEFSVRTQRPDIWKLMFADRNTRWVPRIVATLSKPGTHVIAVGATHLFGPAGLLELLRGQGFQLYRVPQP